MIRLERHQRPLPVVSIIPLVDVLLILLVFFMVTSTFLDLDMLPLSAPESASLSAAQDAGSTLIRISPDGALIHGGQRVEIPEIETFLAGMGNTQILLLPSSQADVQALVRVLDAATALGLSSISVLQLGASP